MKPLPSDTDVSPARSSFDRKAFLARVNDDRDQVLDLIELFLEIYPNSLQRIEAAVQQQDAEAICETAHRFKGSLQFIHAVPAIAAAQRLERIGRKYQADAAAEAFDDLASQIQLLGDELRSFLAAPNR